MTRLDKSTIERLVFNVQKPSRYIGGEINSIVKDEAQVRMAVSYPDMYEIGMSNNGIRILYDVANKINGIACERVFAVDKDFEEVLRSVDIPLFTLETFTPLKELDLIGFNISHELLYTNVLQILDLGHIPINSAERKNCDPIVIAGGESVSNPFPMADFIDAFFIGDGEDGITDIAEVMRKSVAASMDRQDIIGLLSETEGVLIPSAYKFTYSGVKITGIEGKEVQKRISRDSDLKDPDMPIVPNIRIAQERGVVEITRGCPNFCKFCHAGYYGLPYRNYSFEKIQNKIQSIIKNTGYNELTLSSLSVSDYKYLTNLLNRILPELTEHGVSISLPSLRVDKRTVPIIEQISDVRKTSLTFAVESASDEIREIVNKKVVIDDLLSIVEYIFKSGWRLIKLYFMIGLPGCDRHDEADAIIKLLKRILTLKNKRKEINVTLSPFVPKPHTPFQNERQLDLQYFNDTVLKIKKELPGSIKIKNHNPESSILEGLFARGDKRLGQVILMSYNDGCRFDSWKEHFNYLTWKKNLDEIIPEWKSFNDNREDDSINSWSVVKTGFEGVIETRKDYKLDLKNLNTSTNEYDEPLELSSLNEAMEKFKVKYSSNDRIRLKIRKRGLARFIPHIDFIEIIKRAIRRAEIPVSFTQGFNKREKLSLGFPLPLGIESEAELCDVDIYGEIDMNFMESFSGMFPAGIDLLDVYKAEKKESLMSITAAVEYKVEVDDSLHISTILKNIDGKIDFIKETKKGKKEISFQQAISDYNCDGTTGVILRLYAGTEYSMRIDKVILLLAEADYSELHKFKIIKTGQYRIIDDEMTLII